MIPVQLEYLKIFLSIPRLSGKKTLPIRDPQVVVMSKGSIEVVKNFNSIHRMEFQRHNIVKTNG